MEHKEVIVIGSGIAGLLAATILNNRGAEVTVLEKARGVGGRMATRRTEMGLFDHGAQFFTVREPRFQSLVDAWLANSVIKEWSKGFPNDTKQNQVDSHPRYCGSRGMTAPAKHLAENLDIRLQTRVTAISRSNDNWVVEIADGSAFETGFVLLTAPIPQAIALLEAGMMQLSEDNLLPLNEIEYHPCHALLAAFDQPTHVPPPGGLFVNEGPVHWIGDNYQKGISPTHTMTIHSSPTFSQQHFESDHDAVIGKLLSASKHWLPGEPTAVQVHRWRYAQPATIYPQPFYELADPLPLFLAGDGFAGPRVEGAALSGLAAADRIIKMLRY